MPTFPHCAVSRNEHGLNLSSWLENLIRAHGPDEWLLGETEVFSAQLNPERRFNFLLTLISYIKLS